jgi:hypothetical protein
MKQAILYAAIFAVSISCYAHTPNNVHVKKTASDSLFADMQQSLNEILDAVGLQPGIILKEANVPNLEARVSHKKRYIYYNPSFVQSILQATHDKWGMIALLAHETGHHLNGHTIDKNGSTPELELQADEFTGFVLQKLGATVQQAQEVMIFIAKTESSASYPGRATRMLAIQKGWHKSGGLEKAGETASQVKNIITDTRGTF